LCCASPRRCPFILGRNGGAGLGRAEEQQRLAASNAGAEESARRIVVGRRA
jgi:hypothetical protein